MGVIFSPFRKCGSEAAGGPIDHTAAFSTPLSYENIKKIRCCKAVFRSQRAPSCVCAWHQGCTFRASVSLQQTVASVLMTQQSLPGSLIPNMVVFIHPQCHHIPDRPLLNSTLFWVWTVQKDIFLGSESLGAVADHAPRGTCRGSGRKNTHCLLKMW